MNENFYLDILKEYADLKIIETEHDCDFEIDTILMAKNWGKIFSALKRELGDVELVIADEYVRPFFVLIDSVVINRLFCSEESYIQARNFLINKCFTENQALECKFGLESLEEDEFSKYELSAAEMNNPSIEVLFYNVDTGEFIRKYFKIPKQFYFRKRLELLQKRFKAARTEARDSCPIGLYFSLSPKELPQNEVINEFDFDYVLYCIGNHDCTFLERFDFDKLCKKEK